MEASDGQMLWTYILAGVYRHTCDTLNIEKHCEYMYRTVDSSAGLSLLSHCTGNELET